MRCAKLNGEIFFPFIYYSPKKLSILEYSRNRLNFYSCDKIQWFMFNMILTYLLESNEFFFDPLSKQITQEEESRNWRSGYVNSNNKKAIKLNMIILICDHFVRIALTYCILCIRLRYSRGTQHTMSSRKVGPFSICYLLQRIYAPNICNSKILYSEQRNEN